MQPSSVVGKSLGQPPLLFHRELRTNSQPATQRRGHVEEVTAKEERINTNGSKGHKDLKEVMKMEEIGKYSDRDG